MRGEGCLSDFVFFWVVCVDFIPGFSWVRCVIDNGESSVIIFHLKLDQWFYTSKKEVSYFVSYILCCLNVLSWTFWIVLDLVSALHCTHLYCAFFSIRKLSVSQPDREILGLPLVIKRRSSLLKLFDWDSWLILSTVVIC